MSIGVFSPVSLAGIRLNNRIIRSATYEGMADEQGFRQGFNQVVPEWAEGEPGQSSQVLLPSRIMEELRMR